MNGDNILIDTNIALYLLSGDQVIAEILNGKNVYLSFITELELLGYEGISKKELRLINNLLNECIIIDLNQTIKQTTIKIKQAKKLKLPDALIAATAIYMNMPLISADRNFMNVGDLHFIQYEKQSN